MPENYSTWYGRKPDRAVPWTDMAIRNMMMPRAPDGRGYRHAFLEAPGVRKGIARRRYIRRRVLPATLLSVAVLAGLGVWLAHGWL